MTSLHTVMWVPVGERLPTHIYTVLGWITCGAGIGVEPFAETCIYNPRREKWQCAVGGEDDIDVTVSHWMDIPPAPDALTDDLRLSEKP